jgi:predicted dehydrogenase
MSQTIGIGIIGMGWMGETHSRAYRAIADRFHDGGVQPRLVICSDAVAARALAARRRFGFEQATTDWRDVVAHPAVQAINITAPNGMHLELVRAAAAAGKHVLCEKPVGRGPDETLLAWRAARAAGVQTLVGYNYRWAPLVQYAHSLLAAGRLGRITRYHGRFLNGYAGDPLGLLSWRFDGAQGLGTLGDLMSHVIDMALWLAGPISALVADRETYVRQRPLPQPGVGTHYDRGRADDPHGAVTNEDHVLIMARFASGARGTLEACRVVNGAKCDMGFEIHGTDGALRWTMERMNELQLQWRTADPAQDGYTTLLSGPAHPDHRRFNPAWGLNLGYDDLKVIEAERFLSAIASGVPQTPGLAEAAAVARVQQAAIDSWHSGQWHDVAIDPQ